MVLLVEDLNSHVYSADVMAGEKVAFCLILDERRIIFLKAAFGLGSGSGLCPYSFVHPQRITHLLWGFVFHYIDCSKPQYFSY